MLYIDLLITSTCSNYLLSTGEGQSQVDACGWGRHQLRARLTCFQKADVLLNRGVSWHWSVRCRYWYIDAFTCCLD